MWLASLLACGSPGEVPLQPGALLTWLEDGRYLGWPGEPEVHPSLGPHFGMVQTFVNPDLDVSLTAGSAAHPAGAAAVKELLGDLGDQGVLGWSVMVKLDRGEGGDAWHWYEWYDGEQLLSGSGEDPCVGCHEDGSDHVLTPWPQ